MLVAGMNRLSATHTLFFPSQLCVRCVRMLVLFGRYFENGYQGIYTVMPRSVHDCCAIV